MLIVMLPCSSWTEDLFEGRGWEGVESAHDGFGGYKEEGACLANVDLAKCSHCFCPAPLPWAETVATQEQCCSCGLSHIHPCVSAPTSLSAQPVIATLPPSHHSLGGEQSGFLSKLHVLFQPHTSLGATNSPSKRRGVKSFGFYLFLLQGTKVRLVCLSLRLVAVWRTLSSTVCFNIPDSQCLECSLCKLICRKYTWVYCRAKIVNGICKVA